MSKKTTTILMAFLIVLIGIFLVQKYAGQPTGTPASLSELNIEFDPQAVNFIRVFKQDYPDSGLSFARKDTGWVVVNEFNTRAKSEEIKKLFDDVQAVSGSIRGDSDDLYSDFSIDDRNALQIKFLGANDSLLLHFFVGEGGPDGKSCFIRLPGSPNVYMADNNFISRFAAWAASPEKKLPTDRWMNLRLCPIKTQDLAAFKLGTPKTSYEFAQETLASEDTTIPPTKKWTQVTPTKGVALDESKIRSLSSSVTNISAQGVVNPENSTRFGLDKPSYSVWVGDTLGNAILVNFSDKIDTLEQRYVMIQGRDTVYRINKNLFDRIFVTPFEKPKEPKAAAGK
jgi:hypothetical protein